MLYNNIVEFKKNSIDAKKYQSMYEYSINKPDDFWADQAERFITWESKWNRVSNIDYKKGKIAWFEGAKLNVAYNCLDRHLKNRANQIAIIWEGDNPHESKTITYKELYIEVCKFANGLKSIGVKKGDRICLYMPMIIESCVAMLVQTNLRRVLQPRIAVIYATFSVSFHDGFHD